MIVGKLNSKYKPLIVAVFLGIGGLASGVLFFNKTGAIEVRGQLITAPSISLPASPSLIGVAQGAEIVDASAIEDAPTIPVNAPTENSQDFSEIGAVQDPGNPVGPAFGTSQAISYTIQKSDTLASIASSFGISTNIITSSNPSIKGKKVKIGETLQILPASDVIYQSQAGDNLASISSNFNTPQSKILQFNQSVNFSALEPGTTIIIPGGTNANLAASQSDSLPNFNNQFIIPAQGYDEGALDSNNGVNIANSCGTPVVAAADGVVVPDPNISNILDGWNDGYGNFVLIKHAFGNEILTRYAHLQQILVQAGDYVKQGQQIGLMGESGSATECSVNFEVVGAQNPFYISSLNR
jgi:murein DD-endopeptidase MepM/ murein hydrolase activator NlpD